MILGIRLELLSENIGKYAIGYVYGNAGQGFSGDLVKGAGEGPVDLIRRNHCQSFLLRGSYLVKHSA